MEEGVNHWTFRRTIGGRKETKDFCYQEPHFELITVGVVTKTTDLTQDGCGLCIHLVE